MSYQDIIHEDRAHGRQAMHVSDEGDHVQFIRLADIPDSGEPFRARCDECFDHHFWRRVWVKA